MRELLHPPGHRGPVIAAGAVLVTLAVALMQVRFDWATGVHALIAAALAVAWLWLGLQERVEDEPPAYASVLVVLGLAAAYTALQRIADSTESGAVLWTSLVQMGLAFWVSRVRRSAIALLVAALALTAAVLSLWDVVFSPASVTPYRWLLLLLSLAFIVWSLAYRGSLNRHHDQLVNAAGLAVLGIGLSGVELVSFGPYLGIGTGWELVVLAGGIGLVAFGAVDRQPGAAYLGVANLVVFVALAAPHGDTLTWWPLLLLVAGLAFLALGLRPRVPLPPPPPAASTSPGDQPLSARADESGQ